MGFEPLDGIKLIMLMAAGLVFALVGLYLLVRPKPEGSSAKIELFGLKFESSSAGLLVFLIGAAFLSVPMFVPEKAADVAVAEAADDAKPAAEPSSVAPSQAPETLALVAPAQGSSVEEVEPNGKTETAMPIGLEQTVLGQTQKGGDVDWYVMAVPVGGLRGYEVKLKHFNQSGSQVTADVYNKREEHVGYLRARNGATYLPITSDFDDRIYFRVKSSDRYQWDYELSVVPEASN